MQALEKQRATRLWHPLLFFMLTLVLISCTTSGTITSHQLAKKTAVLTTTTPRTLPSLNTARIDAYLSQLASKKSFSGSVLVAHQGVVFSKGYGLADREQHIANTAQTMFRIGSITKQFTALAILMLQQQGKLHVQDHICLYILNCPQTWQPITIEELLTHSSGIPDYINLSDFLTYWTRPMTPEQLISRFRNLPLDFVPGTIFKYSNSGYVLLGYIIERVSGESYATFLQEHIWQPLQLAHTGYDTTHPSLPYHATGYYKGYIKPAPYDMSVLYSAGALYSDVGDLYTWDQALLHHTLLSPQAEDAMFMRHMPCSPSGRGGCLPATNNGYGYGWFLTTSSQGKLIYHEGYIDGFHTYNSFYPQSDLYVIVLTNLETTNVLQLGHTLASMA